MFQRCLLFMMSIFYYFHASVITIQWQVAGVLGMENQISVQFFCTKPHFKITTHCIELQYLLVSQTNEASLQQMLGLFCGNATQVG